MILIAHRGNTTGPKPFLENDPVYIRQALDGGFDAEIDVWLINENYILGHDSPEFFIKESFLENKKLWCHAKNLRALEKMLKNKKIHCFWHQEDKFTLTSKNYIWTYPGESYTSKSVVVKPENHIKNNFKDIAKYNCYGICSDYVKRIK
jgi:hypothetical protein